MTAADAEVVATPTKSRARTRVTHLYHRDQSARATLVGLPTPYLCGRVSRKPLRPNNGDPDIELIGDLIVVDEPDYCRPCLRAAQKLAGEHWERLMDEKRA